MTSSLTRNPKPQHKLSHSTPQASIPVKQTKAYQSKRIPHECKGRLASPSAQQKP
ncbi:hypothetical protein HanIR_Chr05g0253561 [Helianthus annuus]|nr:hypothetical protein HanIR_Chr05g0253561 [Helianthus annuus]